MLNCGKRLWPSLVSVCGGMMESVVHCSCLTMESIWLVTEWNAIGGASGAHCCSSLCTDETIQNQPFSGLPLMEEGTLLFVDRRGAAVFSVHRWNDSKSALFKETAYYRIVTSKISPFRSVTMEEGIILLSIEFCSVLICNFNYTHFS